MVVLGIDPGGSSTGFGILTLDNARIGYLASGTLNPPRKLSFAERLMFIYRGVSALLDEHEIDLVAVEDVFQGANAKTAARIGHVRGVVLLAAAEAGVPASEYPPAEVKKAVVGNGQASKEQVLFMVKQIVGDVIGSQKHDEADAVAVAICHCHRAVRESLR